MFHNKGLNVHAHVLATQLDVGSAVTSMKCRIESESICLPRLYDTGAWKGSITDQLLIRTGCCLEIQEDIPLDKVVDKAPRQKRVSESIFSNFHYSSREGSICKKNSISSINNNHLQKL
ncbi:hypothetical protein XELAEV_18029351mg [Xenopus laevis]|uniref:Uncharacterized protein n=1 Tax=Xenopus laevis TaxID=8355 RepID=A0A974HHP0_XENLA|nr:hypothetical protein XELAEV_18029351mg [Xenopus laevis]